MGNPQPSSKLSNMGFIYIITSPSGKSYIGQTKRSVNLRIEEHFKCQKSCILLENAIKKYGRDIMKIEILIEINNSLLDYYEILFISFYNTCEPYGYNIQSGGSCGIHSKQSRLRMRNAKLGYKNHNFGKPRTDITKERISNAKSGMKHHFYGKHFSKAHIDKLSISHRKSHTELPMYVIYIKSRPEHYTSSGFAVVNHPKKPNKYFTSKKYSDDEKLTMAINYLNSA